PTAALIATTLRRDLDDLIAHSAEKPAVQSVTMMRGLPGVGKTTLAATLAHDTELRQAFPDGFLWCALGQTPNTLAELRAWTRALRIGTFDDETELDTLRSRLASYLRNRKLLLIIDDAWKSEHARDLMVGGPG